MLFVYVVTFLTYHLKGGAIAENKLSVGILCDEEGEAQKV
jgi:hypothetical protein